MDINLSENYNQLIHQISETYIQGQKNAVVSVNAHLVQTYHKNQL